MGFLMLVCLFLGLIAWTLSDRIMNAFNKNKK